VLGKEWGGWSFTQQTCLSSSSFSSTATAGGGGSIYKRVIRKWRRRRMNFGLTKIFFLSCWLIIVIVSSRWCFILQNIHYWGSTAQKASSLWNFGHNNNAHHRVLFMRMSGSLLVCLECVHWYLRFWCCCSLLASRFGFSGALVHAWSAVITTIPML
jgi:hypothetical protein